MKLISLLLVLLAINSSCNQPEDDASNNSSGEKQYRENNLAMATLYTYYSEEYRALCQQAFSLAAMRIDQIALNRLQTNNLAVVVDIDETVLDNSPYEALLIAADTLYPYCWNNWCNLAKARAVPGALEFLKHADVKGFQVFYLSNRKDSDVKEGTMDNLKKLGFPQVSHEHILLREPESDINPDPGNKEARREKIRAMGYEIVLLAGDNLGDFYVDTKDPVERGQMMENSRYKFGKDYIVLPNAMYGNWTNSAGITGQHSIDSLIGIMVDVFGEACGY